MSTAEYEGIFFEDPHRQAELDRLIEAVTVAANEREPISQGHRRAERDLDDGTITENQFRVIDDRYLAANNKIAAAKRAVDAYLAQNRDYKAR